jgi:hypothetical protein
MRSLDAEQIKAFDAADLQLCATRIAERYMGKERAREFGERNSGPGEVVVRVRITHAVGEADLAD